jgi:hypothetical protein
MASVDHQHVTAISALPFVMSSILGGTAGSAICGAIWTNTVLEQLEQNLPKSATSDLALICEMPLAQLSYPVDNPARDAIAKAYG